MNGPFPRRETHRVRAGSVEIGGGAPVSVQTMANADPRDAAALSRQIASAADLGADIVRLTVPDFEAARVFAAVRKSSPVPLVADIHFNHRLALAALDAGADALRLNPGNIGGATNVREVARAASARGTPIRIGVNGGSLERDLLERYGSATPEALVESAMRHVSLLEAEGFGDIVVSVKASDVPRTLAAYRLLSEKTRHPLHVGVTEAGTLIPGIARSSVAIGALLMEGIGDTIRVSLTDLPEREVRAGVEILRALGLRAPGASITSCPTCGRTKVDLFKTASEVEAALEKHYLAHPGAPRPKVAVMGCVVNGPGEARDADIALCGANGSFYVFSRGERSPDPVPADEAAAAVLSLVENFGK